MNLGLVLAVFEPFGTTLAEQVQNKSIVACTFLVVLAVLFFAFLAQNGFTLIPKSMAAVFEHIFDWLDEIAQGFMGPEGRKHVPFAMSLFLFIMFSNWSGLLPIPTFIFAESHQPAQRISAETPPAETPEGSKAEATEGEGPEIEVGWEAPSASYNTTLALALISFFAFNYYGLKKKIFPPAEPAEAHSHDHDHEHGHSHDHAHDHGHDAHPHNPGGLYGLWQWITHFWQPVPSLARSGLSMGMVVPLFFLFIVLNILEEVARILSLSIRLYGNIYGEHQVKLNLIKTIHQFTVAKGGALWLLGQGNLVGGFGYFGMSAMLWATSAFATCLGALAGFIQAMVFAMLTLSYIAHAVADEH